MSVKVFVFNKVSFAFIRILLGFFGNFFKYSPFASIAIFADSTKEAFKTALLFVNQDHPNVTIIVKRVEG